MTSERIDLAAIRARVAAATPGPYTVGEELVDPNDPAWNVFEPNGSAVAAFCTLRHATLFACAPTDLAALCDEVERLAMERDTLRADVTRYADGVASAERGIAVQDEEIATLRSELDDARNVALGLTEDCAGLRASLEEISKASIDLIAAGDRLCAENVLMREIIAGRTVAPTGAEVDAHRGAFLWMRMEQGEAIACTRGGCERESFDSIAFGFVWFREDLDDELPKATGARWWALDASGAPCAWPVVTGGVE